MLNGDNNENDFKTNRSISKKTNWTSSTLFLLISKKRVWLIVAGRVSRVQSRVSRVQSRGRGSKVAVAGPKSRSRVQCRGRGKWFGVQGNWVKMTDMKTI